MAQMSPVASYQDPRVGTFQVIIPLKWIETAPAEDEKMIPVPPHKPRARTRTPSKQKGLLAPVKTDNLPAELKGARFLTYHDNRGLCWSHSCEGCKLEASGQPPSCREGVHACAYCRKPGHGARACWHNPSSPNHNKEKGKGTLFCVLLSCDPRLLRQE